MADLADMSEQDSSFLEDVEIRRIREQAKNIPKGEPGTCVYCQEYFSRVVNGYCGRCRDILIRQKQNQHYE